MYKKRDRIVAECKFCGNELSGRSDSFFCSDKCRVTFHNRKERTQEERDERARYTREWYLNNKKYSPERLMFFRIRRVAAKENIPFNIEISDIQIPKKCPLLNIDLYFSDYQAMPNTPSIDKIIPKLGYVKGNVWVISYKANMMKQDVDIKTLKLFCRNVLTRL